MPRRLAVYQALWAMSALSDPEASLAEKFDKVKDGGFDGIALDLGAISIAEARGCIAHFTRTGLGAALTAFPKSDADLRAATALAHELRSPFLVVIGQDMPVGLDDMTHVVERWLRIAAIEKMPLQFETHRNCITNDLYTTVQLLDRVPEMRLAADLSHYVVDREMPCPPTEPLQSLIERLLTRSDSFQGRIAARGQIQIPLAYRDSDKWIEMFKGWWKAGFASWKMRHESGDEPLIFLCELGPPDYALTDLQGREMSDRWGEALQLARWARALWET